MNQEMIDAFLMCKDSAKFGKNQIIECKKNVKSHFPAFSWMMILLKPS